MSILIQANSFQFEIRNEKELRMDGKYIVIEFGDIYQQKLVENYRWDEDTTENEMDAVLQKNFEGSGLDCDFHWEDRGVFLLEGPSLNSKDVANSLLSLFPNFRMVKTNQLKNLSILYL
jgi:hypothetical protein